MYSSVYSSVAYRLYSHLSFFGEKRQITAYSAAFSFLSCPDEKYCEYITHLIIFSTSFSSLIPHHLIFFDEMTEKRDEEGSLLTE